MSHHSTALVETDVGEGTRVWAFSHIMKDVLVGRNCNIGSHCFIEAGASIGDNVTLKNNNMVFAGVTLKEGVFVGSGVTFTNDRYPRSPRLQSAKSIYETNDWFLTTTVERGASLGAASIVLAGISVGEYSLVAAGALVTRDVPAHALVMGQPAVITAWVCRCAQTKALSKEELRCEICGYGLEPDEA